MLFIDETPNIRRQSEFDLAKAFTILVMVITHIYEEASVVDYTLPISGAFDHILQFLAGPLGAPMFMIAMGVGIVYSSHRTPGELAVRGLKLFLMSYVLGIFRFGIMYAALSLANGTFDAELCFELVFNVDILQFAGLAFLLTALLKHWRVPVPVMGILAVLMQIAGQLLERIEISGVVGKCLLGLFFYTSDDSCFPLLLWYIYPVIGIIFAKYLRHISDPDKFYKSLLLLSVTVLAGLTVSLSMAGYNLGRFYFLQDDLLYRQDFLTTLFTFFVVTVEMSVFHFLWKGIRSDRLKQGILYLSNNLNVLYILQWLITGNVAAILWVLDLPYLEKWAIVPAGLLVFVVIILLSKLWLRVTHHRSNKT